MSQHPSLHELKSLTSRVIASRAAVRRGEMVDIGLLQEKVTKLCTGIEAMPAEAGRPFKTAVLGLLEETEALAEALRAALAILKEQLGASGDRRRALKAYGQRDGGRGGARLGSL